MKISKKYLQRIINEEIKNIILEIGKSRAESVNEGRAAARRLAIARKQAASADAPAQSAADSTRDEFLAARKKAAGKTAEDMVARGLAKKADRQAAIKKYGSAKGADQVARGLARKRAMSSDGRRDLSNVVGTEFDAGAMSGRGKSGAAALQAQGVAVPSSYHKNSEAAEKQQASYREQPSAERTKGASKTKSSSVKAIFDQVGKDVLNKVFKINLKGKEHSIKFFNHDGGAAFNISGNIYKILSTGITPKISAIRTDGHVLKITGSWGPFRRSVVLSSSKVNKLIAMVGNLRPGKAGSIQIGKNKIKLVPARRT